MNPQDAFTLSRIGIAVVAGVVCLFLSFMFESRNVNRRMGLLSLIGWILIIGGAIYFLMFFGDNVLDYGRNIIRRLSP